MGRLKISGFLFFFMLLGVACILTFPSSSQADISDADSLIGYRWDGSHLEIVSINPSMDSTSIIAALDLTKFDDTFSVDADNRKAYVFAKDLNMDSRIYTIDLITGKITSILYSVFEFGFGFDSYKKDTLIGYRWSNIDNQEQIISIDPTTGTTELIAPIALDLDLQFNMLVNNFAVDSENNKAYLYGAKDFSPSSDWYIFTIDLTTGSVSRKIFTEKGFGFDSYKEDTLIGYRWNGLQEEIISIDPGTGSIFAIATLDVSMININAFAVDSGKNKAYLYAGNMNQPWSIYTIDLITKESSNAPFTQSGTGGFGFDSYVNVANSVKIDIKPGGFPNSINPRSKGKTPVAILTTDTFDATTVDTATVRFGKTGTEAAPVHVGFADVDGEGNTDVILHFNTQDTGIQCGDTAAFLTGTSFGGQPFDGTDFIKTSGCK